MPLTLMLNRLASLLAGNATRRRTTRIETSSPAPNPDFVELNAVAPLSHAAQSPAPDGTAPHANSIVRREALLGADQRVIGYLFKLRFDLNQRVRASSTLVQRLYDDVLLRNLQSMGVQRLLEHRMAFISVSASSLAMPALEQLHAPGVVYVVDSIAQHIDHPAPVLERLAALRAQGYRIGFAGKALADVRFAPFLALADYVFVDIGHSDIPRINSLLAMAAAQSAAIRCVAVNIPSLDDFAVCAKLPFQIFHGPFVTSRETWNVTGVDAARVKLLQLLNALRGDAPTSELGVLFKQDPALSFKLLRYLNAVGVGQAHPVKSIEQALLVIGRQKLYRWLTLLLFTSGSSRKLDWALLENALVRARLAEQLSRTDMTTAESDEVFVAGLFSLLDIVLGIPIETVLAQVNLPQPVNEVLLDQRGKYAPYLALAIACEHADAERIAELAQAIGVDSMGVNSLHIDALLWAQSVAD